jgi:tRNA A37 methylthiotransferase MiaB
MKQKTKLCPHIHIPFQSGSDTILKSMHRGYTVQEAKTFIDNIKNIQRDISITTDIIVGYPDETEKDFEATLDLVEYGKFDMIYIGIYSPRPWTYCSQTSSRHYWPQNKTI